MIGDKRALLCGYGDVGKLGTSHLQMVAHCALGLVDVYNLLPEHVVEQK